MNKFLNYTRNCLLEAIVAEKFILSYSIMLIINGIVILLEYSQNLDILYVFDSIIVFGPFSLLAIVAASIPYSDCFCNSWITGQSYLCIIRISSKKYAGAKAIAVYISGFCSVFLSLVTTVLVLSLFLPFANPELDNFSYFLNSPLGDIISKNPFVYFILRATIFSASCGFWALVGLLSSAFFLKKNVSYVAPLCIYYFVENASAALSIPPQFNIGLLMVGNVRIGSSLGTFFTITGVNIVCSLVVALLFMSRVDWRINNE